MQSFTLFLAFLALVACASAIHVPANIHTIDRPSDGEHRLSYDPRSESYDADLADRDVDAPSIFSGFGVKQCVQGPADYNVLTFGAGRVGGVSVPNAEFGFGPASLAVDPANKRFVFYNAGGYQFTLDNGTYTTSPNALTGVNECFLDRNNSYDWEVNDHTTLLEVHDGLFSRFYGKTPDVGSGHTHTGFNIFTGPAGVIRRLEFSQGYPVPAFFPPQSLTATGIIRYNENCPTNGPTFAARFQLPSICWLDDLPAWSTYHRFD